MHLACARRSMHLIPHRLLAFPKRHAPVRIRVLAHINAPAGSCMGMALSHADTLRLCRRFAHFAPSAHIAHPPQNGVSYCARPS
eukprot:3815442-Alexandrium_andersonii.AAC.1